MSFPQKRESILNGSPIKSGMTGQWIPDQVRDDKRWGLTSDGNQPPPCFSGSQHVDTVYKIYNNYTMEFEFDPAKSQTNKDKHGIDFIEAQRLWDDPDFVEIPARVSDEPRFMVIGRISGKHWSGVITYRTNRVRIISVRCSRPEEIGYYESERI